MALTESQELYEVLLRFEGGTLKGAHAQYLNTIQRDGVTITATPGDAVPLSLVADVDKPTLTKVLTAAKLALLTAKETAESEAAALKADNAAKDANIQELLARAEEAEKKVAAFVASFEAENPPAPEPEPTPVT